MARDRKQTTPERIAATKRSARALELRASGMSFENIAKEAGYESKQSAFAAVKRALQMTLQEPADELRDIEHARLEMLQAVWFPRALKDDKDAAAVVLKIAERRARLLGLDAPVRFSGELGPKTTPEQANTLLRERLAALEAPEAANAGA